MRPARKGPENARAADLAGEGIRAASMRPARKGPENFFASPEIGSETRASMRPARKGPENQGGWTGSRVTIRLQ